MAGWSRGEVVRERPNGREEPGLFGGGCSTDLGRREVEV